MHRLVIHCWIKHSTPDVDCDDDDSCRVLGIMVPAAQTRVMTALIAGEGCDSLTWSQLAQEAR